MLTVDSHPLLDFHAFVTSFPTPLQETVVPGEIRDLLRADSRTPPIRGTLSWEQIREAIRNLLRHGGFKPTGRSKPASEYLVRAAGEGSLSSINLAVDTCNVVSLHSGVPISVIDLDRVTEPAFRIAIAPPSSSYIFNQSGQTIDLTGLLCLFDPEGPCANAVKDAQRTKTSGTTRKTLSILWGTNKLPGLTERAAEWYHGLLRQCGADIQTL